MAKIFHLVPLEYRTQIESEELYSPASLEDEDLFTVVEQIKLS